LEKVRRRRKGISSLRRYGGSAYGSRLVEGGLQCRLHDGSLVVHLQPSDCNRRVEREAARRSEITGEAARAQPQRGTGRECHVRAVAERCAVDRDAVQVGEDQTCGLTEYLHRTGENAAWTVAHFIQDHARGLAGEARVGTERATELTGAVDEAVVEDKTDRIDVEVLIAVEREAGGVGRADVDHAHAVGRVEDLGREADRGERIGDRAGERGRGEQAHSARGREQNAEQQRADQPLRAGAMRRGRG